MADRDFDAGMAALRREFAEKLVERMARLAAAKAALDAAANDPARRQALGDMVDTAHQLSGSGALFGFPEVGAAARDLEQACQDAQAVNAWPPRGPLIDRAWARLQAAAEPEA